MTKKRKKSFDYILGNPVTKLMKYLSVRLTLRSLIVKCSNLIKNQNFMMSFPSVCNQLNVAMYKGQKWKARKWARSCFFRSVPIFGRLLVCRTIGVKSLNLDARM